MIIDASVVLRAFFPDEAQSQVQNLIREHIADKIRLKAPALLPYEVSNAIWQAERRLRITTNQADEIVKAFAGLDIKIIPQTWEEMLSLTRQFKLSAYDAAYLRLAEMLSEPLITGDERLYNNVHQSLNWVIWIEDYPI